MWRKRREHEWEFRQENWVRTEGESVLIADPTYLADVFSSEDATARYIRTHGVILDDFGGDICCPVCWQFPFLWMPLTDTEKESLPPLDIRVLSPSVCCDSACFVFLPMSQEIPCELKERWAHDGAMLELPSGIWSVWYEGKRDMFGRPRRIVACCDPRPITPTIQLSLSLFEARL